MKPIGISLYLGPSFGLVMLFAAVGAPLVAQEPPVRRGALPVSAVALSCPAGAHVMVEVALPVAHTIVATRDLVLELGSTPAIAPTSGQSIGHLRR